MATATALTRVKSEALICINPARGAPCKPAGMCPLPESPVLAHARCALLRIEAGAAALRDRLGEAEHHELASGLASLVEGLASLEDATEAQIPARWSHFFRCYDHALATLRECEKQARPGA